MRKDYCPCASCELVKRHCRGFEDLLIVGSHPTQTINQGKREREGDNKEVTAVFGDILYS